MHFYVLLFSFFSACEGGPTLRWALTHTLGRSAAATAVVSINSTWLHRVEVRAREDGCLREASPNATQQARPGAEPELLRSYIFI